MDKSKKKDKKKDKKAGEQKRTEDQDAAVDKSKKKRKKKKNELDNTYPVSSHRFSIFCGFILFQDIKFQWLFIAFYMRDLGVMWKIMLLEI